MKSYNNIDDILDKIQDLPEGLGEYVLKKISDAQLNIAPTNIHTFHNLKDRVYLLIRGAQGIDDTIILLETDASSDIDVIDFIQAINGLKLQTEEKNALQELYIKAVTALWRYQTKQKEKHEYEVSYRD